MIVKLTQKQAWTLLALNDALTWHTDTTCEISYHDDGWVPPKPSGTGQRLKALEAKGLCVRGRLWSKRAGHQWSFTSEGRELAGHLHLLYQKARGRARQAGESFSPPDLSGTYDTSALDIRA
jgi:hypothetical protein